MPSSPRDPRTFRPFVKLTTEGTVAAVVYVADHAPAPVDGRGSIYVDVSAFGSEGHAPRGGVIRGGGIDLSDPQVMAVLAAAKAIADERAAPRTTPLPITVTPPPNVTKGPLSGG